MYRIKVDGQTIHDPAMGELAYVVNDATLTQAANCADQFVFTVYPQNIGYANINWCQSAVEVYDEGELIFRGRPINDTVGWLNQKTITCEGDLAFLNDSIVRPYEYQGSVEKYLQNLLSWHNEQMTDDDKKIYPRTITVTDPNDLIVRANSNYPSTMAEVQNKLVSILGGYLILERVDGVNYLDYLADSPYPATQKIQLNTNLLDFKRINKGDSIATALIPLGSQIEGSDERLTIASVNDGLDYIVNEEAAGKYGLIFTTAIWDDVTIPANLLRKAKAALATMTGTTSLELTAADLHQADASIEQFKILRYVTVEDAAHNASGRYLITKKTTSLVNPANNKITIGKESAGLSDAVNQNTAQIDSDIKNVKKYLVGAIEKATDQITGVDGGYVVIHRDDKTGKPYEILVMDTDDITTAVNVWRWNKNGWGHSSSGYNGTYDLAATQDGSIVADAIATGILKSRDYEEGVKGFRFNINTGTLEAPSLKADITDSVEITIKETADSLSDEISGTNNKINDLSQQVNTNASTFQQFADSINATIINTMLASGEWDGLLQQMTAIKATADGLSVDVSSLTNNLAGFVTEYHTYFTATAEGLRISKSGSQFATLLSDTKLSFIQAGQEVAYIQYNRLYITEAWVKSGLSIESTSGGSYIRQYVDSNNVFCIQSMETEG